MFRLFKVQHIFLQGFECLDVFLIRKVTLSFLTLNKITEKQTQIHRNEYKTKMQKQNRNSDIICIYFN